jgi:hypothetical protein
VGHRAENHKFLENSAADAINVALTPSEVLVLANFCSRATGTHAGTRRRCAEDTMSDGKQGASGGQGEPPEARERRAGEGRKTEGSVSSRGAYAPLGFGVTRRWLGDSNSPTWLQHALSAFPVAR